LESAEYSRDLIRSQKFQYLYPDVDIKEDKDTKSNYMVVKKIWRNGIKRLPNIQQGGNRYSTSVGGTLTGFHGHILIWDDPLNPKQAVSDVERDIANHWIDQTASTRKVDKSISVTIVVMQRLHQDDVTGHILSKHKKNLRHISLPGEILRFKENLNPPELEEMYVDGLLDPSRMPLKVLQDLEEDMGQYGYAGQIGQNPTPPEGGMFKVDNFEVIDTMVDKSQISYIVRYWDKAGTKEKYDGKPGGAYTVGCKMAKLKNGKFVIMDIKRGRWEATERELIIKQTAQSDGAAVYIYMEQEPGSGGKESAQSTIRNLAGFAAYADIPHGDKIYRADPYSVQVNNSNVMLLRGLWNSAFIEEHRFFPNSKFKDQVDASAGAFGKLSGKRMVQSLIK
jgi:predicted phage terminase large subunit-like protein